MGRIKELWDFTVEKTIYEKESIYTCKKEIDENNTLILQTMLFAVSIILAVNFLDYSVSSIILKMPIPSISWIYLGAMILALGIFVYIKFISSKYIIQMTYLVYILAFLYSFLICVSVSDNVTVTFLLILFMVSTLYIDYGWRIHLFMTIATLTYTNIIVPLKDVSVQESEIENAYTVLFLLFIIGTIARNSRLEAFRTKDLLRKYAYVDQLTGVNNRRKLFEVFAEIQKDGIKNDITAVALLDIDNFKLYNDTYGHGAGDDVLRQVGKSFNELSEKGEISCYRYGGEEFAILYKNINEEKINEYTDNIMQVIRNLEIEHSSSMHNIVTVSIGVALMLENAQPKFERALSIADKALYKAKDSGRNKKEVFNYYDETHINDFSKVRQRDA